MPPVVSPLLRFGSSLLLAAVAPSASDSPLPPCPDTLNCERTSREYDVSPDSLYVAAQKALESLGPTTLRLHPEERRAEAVYRVALVFKDDVDLVVEPGDPGSRLFIRSASRVGYSDLGVNRRRVERFFEALHRALDDE